MTAALEKRLKRHVVGRPHVFFAVTAPGLEEIVRSELGALGIEGRTVPGGVEFTGRLHEAFLANLHLRAAGRILMRLHAFATTQFSGLEHEAAQVPWELYLSPGTLGRIQVATHHCRLHHTEAIAERVRSAAEKRLGTPPAAGGEAVRLQQVYVRGVDDRFTISLDSSGERLHLRGIKTHPGRAPLRETLAAAALIQAGFTAAEPLLDPMCGTGTFALEAALLAKGIPPGWFRDFAFEAWPAFRPQRWAYLRRMAGERIATLGRPGIFASDIDPDACRALGDCTQEHGLTDAVRVQTADFFGLDPADLPVPGPGLVVINPPYGRRLGTPSEGRHLVQSILARLHERFAGWRFVLVVPASVRPTGLPRDAAVYPVVHGGLNVQFCIGRIGSDRKV